MQALEDAVAALREEVQSLRDEVAELKNRPDPVSPSAIADIHEELSTLRQGLESKKSDESRPATLSGADLKAQFTSMGPSIGTSVATDVAVLKADLARLRTDDFKALKAEVEAIKSDIESDPIKGEVRALKALTDELKHEQRKAARWIRTKGAEIQATPQVTAQASTEAMTIGAQHSAPVLSAQTGDASAGLTQAIQHILRVLKHHGLVE
jgi:hypothetical protein